MAKFTHVVIHPKLNFMVGGKLKRLEVGTELALTDEQAKSLGDKVQSIKEKKQLDLADKATNKK